MIDISDLSKPLVLAALYNASKPQGMGFLQFNPTPMTESEAAEILKVDTRFDYLKGRVMKIRIEDKLNPWGYDRDNGQGAAQRAIDALRVGGENCPAIVQTHRDSTKAAAASVLTQLDKESTIKETNGFAVVSLGLSDVAGPLGRAANEAMENP